MDGEGWRSRFHESSLLLGDFCDDVSESSVASVDVDVSKSFDGFERFFFVALPLPLLLVESVSDLGSRGDGGSEELAVPLELTLLNRWSFLERSLF